MYKVERDKLFVKPVCNKFNSAFSHSNLLAKHDCADTMWKIDLKSKMKIHELVESQRSEECQGKCSHCKECRVLNL